MIKKIIIAAIVIIGAGLAFSGLLERGAGPQATFTLSAPQLAWLTDLPGLTFDMEEAGSRAVPGSVAACYAKREVSFSNDGAASIQQTCIDEEKRRFDHQATVSWRLDADRLCLDARPLDRDPACWRIIFRNGTLEFENEGHVVRWFATAKADSVASSKELLAGLQERGPTFR